MNSFLSINVNRLTSYLYLFVKMLIHFQVLVVKEQPTACHSSESTASQQPAPPSEPSQNRFPSTSVSTTTCTARNSEECGKGQYLLSERGVNKLSLNLNLVSGMIPQTSRSC